MQYKIVQRYGDRPEESIAGPFETEQDAIDELAAFPIPGEPNPKYRPVREPDVEYRVVPVSTRGSRR